MMKEKAEPQHSREQDRAQYGVEKFAPDWHEAMPSKPDPDYEPTKRRVKS